MPLPWGILVSAVGCAVVVPVMGGFVERVVDFVVDLVVCCDPE